jgi:2-polyprenyl-6-methoxyphenol hydroxylase-like FAD-dependent oxidoreductase
MAQLQHDVIIVGGGIAGATLARSLADTGMRVVVLEREQSFKDRVRGEQMQPWGVAEAERLGVLGLLQTSCGHDQPWVDMFLGPAQMMHRNLTETTPQQAPHFNFYHPDMQETLLRAAAEAGVEVRRGVTVVEAQSGPRPTVTIDNDGTAERLSGRLIVGADGRNSALRRAGHFPVRRDAPFLVIAGVLLENMTIADDTGLIYLDPVGSRGAYWFPQGGGRVRVYAAFPATGKRINGASDWTAFVETSVAAGAPADAFEGTHIAGPLASFDAADHWVEDPYRDGIVLIGDAASANDPSWGQGLSLTLRDVRVLRDELVASSDWDRACHAYAQEHDRHYSVIHEVTLVFKEMFLKAGADADARRARALPLIAADPMRIPDHLFSGPDLPWNPDIVRTFFGGTEYPIAG